MLLNHEVIINDSQLKQIIFEGYAACWVEYYAINTYDVQKHQEMWIQIYNKNIYNLG